MCASVVTHQWKTLNSFVNEQPWGLAKRLKFRVLKESHNYSTTPSSVLHGSTVKPRPSIPQRQQRGGHSKSLLLKEIYLACLLDVRGVSWVYFLWLIAV